MQRAGIWHSQCIESCPCFHLNLPYSIFLPSFSGAPNEMPALCAPCSEGSLDLHPTNHLQICAVELWSWSPTTSAVILVISTIFLRLEIEKKISATNNMMIESMQYDMIVYIYRVFSLHAHIIEYENLHKATSHPRIHVTSFPYLKHP